MAEDLVWLVEQARQPGITVSANARMHGVRPGLVAPPARRGNEDGQAAVRTDQDVVPDRRGRGPLRHAEDTTVLGEIRAIIDARLTSSHCPVAALFGSAGWRPCERPRNRNRVSPFRRQASSLPRVLTRRHTIRAYAGTGVAAESSRPRSSDRFDIPCWGREVVCVAFARDATDRGAMAFPRHLRRRRVRQDDPRRDARQRRRACRALSAPKPVPSRADSAPPAPVARQRTSPSR